MPSTAHGNDEVAGLLLMTKSKEFQDSIDFIVYLFLKYKVSQKQKYQCRHASVSPILTIISVSIPSILPTPDQGILK